MVRTKVGALASVAVLALMTACSSDADDDPTSGTENTRQVEHALGTAEVPNDPQHIVATDELAGLAALSVGYVPEVVLASTGDAPAQGILGEAGAEVREVPPVTVPTVEEMIELAPDLIVAVGPEGPIADAYDDLSEVAPVLVLDIEGEWRELIGATADAFGKPDAGDAQVTLIEQKLEAAAEASDKATLSLLGYSTEPFSMPPHSPSSTLIDEAGFARPEWQLQETDSYSLPMSEELLDQQDADVIVMPDGLYYSSAPLLDNPLSSQLTGTIVHPVAEQWFGVTGFAFFVIASDLDALAHGSTDVSTEETLPALWDEFAEVA